MARSYFSIVIDRPATAVWSAVCDFGACAWAGTGVDATMEEGRPGEAVGAVRRVATSGAHSGSICSPTPTSSSSYSYELCEPSPSPVRSYVATLRVTPVVDGGRAFVEWWATFDAGADTDHWVAHSEGAVAGWLASLRAVCVGEGAGS